MLLLITIVSSFLSSSFVEYYIHRFLFHSSYKHSHVQEHHKIFHGVNSYEFKDVNAYDIISNKKEMLLKVVLTLPIGFLIFIENKSYGLFFVLLSALYCSWSEYVHLHFHKSSIVLIARFEFFKRLKEHHRIHHYAYNTNYGIGTTIWDVILRTKKR